MSATRHPDHNNWRDLLRAMDQSIKIRGLLNAPYAPVRDIKRPKGMRSVRYNGLLRRLAMTEDRLAVLLGKEFQPRGGEDAAEM